MPAARVNGVELYYEALGAGPTLIVAHGLMGSVAQMRRQGDQIELLAARGLRVIAYDARGHGRSEGTRNNDDYTWSAQAADLFALMHALGVDRASIYGGSMGAGVALTLALEQPDAVERLVLRSPPPLDESIRDELRPFAQIAALYRILGTPLTSRIVALSPQGRAAARRDPQLDLRAFIGAQQARSIPCAVAALRDGPRLPVSRFPEIGHPALVLAHDGDRLHPLASAEVLRDTMPHARLAVAPDARYWQENPVYLAEVVAAFVKGELSSAAGERTIVHQHATEAEEQ